MSDQQQNTVLPAIMVAPNGARKVKADHPAIPLGAAEIGAVARACANAGAGAIHFHVRDDAGGHVLDAGQYREVIAELKRTVPGMHLQITTETVGRYQPEDMRAIVRDVVPEGASIGVSEMVPSRMPTAEDIRSTTGRRKQASSYNIFAMHQRMWRYWPRFWRQPNSTR